MPIALLVQILCTLMMTGIIWFVQVVHYPLFMEVSAGSFPLYETQHATRTGWVVAPLMCAELAAAMIFLVPRFRPAQISLGSAVWGAFLVILIWGSTAFIQVPLHSRLHSGYDAEVIRRLVATNWIRTIAWSTRSALVLIWTIRLLR